LVWSASAGIPPPILAESRTLAIPSIRFDGNPIELGKACGIPYKVSVFAIKAGGDAVLSQFESSKDYGSDGSASGSTIATERKKDDALESGVKKERKRKKKETDTTKEPAEETSRATAKTRANKNTASGETEKKERKKKSATKSESEKGRERKKSTKTNVEESEKQSNDNVEETED
jgi:hypothetical protein